MEHAFLLYICLPDLVPPYFKQAQSPLQTGLELAHRHVVGSADLLETPKVVLNRMNKIIYRPVVRHVKLAIDMLTTCSQFVQFCFF